MRASVVDEVIALYAARGADRYAEDLSQTAHATQAAALAVAAGRPDAFVVACLLHDVGHLLLGDDPRDGGRGRDARHETVGARWLRARFGRAVWGPVALHVRAKRYLAAVEPAYLGRLSDASRSSLRAQGGPLSRRAAGSFAWSASAAEAVALRRIDDTAKDPSRDDGPFERFAELVERHARPGA